MRLGGIASVAAEIRAFVRFMDVSGFIRPISLNHTLQANRTHSEDTADLIFGDDGWIVGEPTIIGAQSDGSEIDYGTVWVRLRIRDPTLQANVVTIAQGKLGAWKGVQGIEEKNPLEGRGHHMVQAIADDIAPVDIQEPLAATHTLRRIDGFIWYYHASNDVATRTLRAATRDLGEGLPTGMTSGTNTTLQEYPSAGSLSLTADQEGTIYVNGRVQSFAVSVDNGTRTYEDTKVQRIPFPLWVDKDDVGEFFFDVGSANANDRHTIYMVGEEWFHP